MERPQGRQSGPGDRRTSRDPVAEPVDRAGWVYRHSSFREVCGQLALSRLSGRDGAFLLLGAPRVGKTTLIDHVLRTAPAFAKAAVVTCAPEMSGAKLLETLSADSQRPREALGGGGQLGGLDPADLDLSALDAPPEADHRLTIVLDSAERAPDEVLEIAQRLPMLSGERDGRVGLILVGRPELAARLDAPGLSELKQDIAFRTTLNSLPDNEVFGLVATWLDSRPDGRGLVFADDAIERIARAADGVPERVLRLCRASIELAGGAADGPIDRAAVDRAIARGPAALGAAAPAGETPGRAARDAPDVDATEDWPASDPFELEDCEVEPSNPGAEPSVDAEIVPEPALPGPRLDSGAGPLSSSSFRVPRPGGATARGFAIGLTLGLAAAVGAAVAVWTTAGPELAENPAAGPETAPPAVALRDPGTAPAEVEPPAAAPDPAPPRAVAEDDPVADPGEVAALTDVPEVAQAPRTPAPEAAPEAAPAPVPEPAARPAVEPRSPLPAEPPPLALPDVAPATPLGDPVAETPETVAPPPAAGGTGPAAASPEGQAVAALERSVAGKLEAPEDTTGEPLGEPLSERAGEPEVESADERRALWFRNDFERSLTALKRRDIQEALASLALDPGPRDGVIGKRTRDAIRSFQAAQGLAVTGDLEPTLVRLLLSRARPTGALEDRPQRAALPRDPAPRPEARAAPAESGRARAPGESEAEWLERLAEAGDRVAQTNLGQRYYHGNGVARDHAAAALWYRRAAEQGDATAQTNLGRLYFNGEGVPLDKRKAAEWSLAGALQGNATAQFNLGLMYRYGSGVDKDLGKASHWLRKAVEQNEPGARAELDQITAELQPPTE